MDITSTLKNGNEIKWKESSRASLHQIKKSLGEAPTLVSPYYRKYFMVFHFYLEYTIVTILLHKNKEGYKRPISFLKNKEGYKQPISFLVGN
jgi:hypothetical protein